MTDDGSARLAGLKAELSLSLCVCVSVCVSLEQPAAQEDSNSVELRVVVVVGMDEREGAKIGVCKLAGDASFLSTGQDRSVSRVMGKVGQ